MTDTNDIAVLQSKIDALQAQMVLTCKIAGYSPLALHLTRIGYRAGRENIGTNLVGLVRRGPKVPLGHYMVYTYLVADLEGVLPNPEAVKNLMKNV